MNSQLLIDKSLAITGVDGFVGRHLARQAAELGVSVTGISRSTQVDTELSGILDHFYSVDLRQKWPSNFQPNLVIHLAGRAAVGPSFDDPQGYIADNSAMVTNMCEALLDSSSRIIGVSSGSLYDSTNDANFFDENSATVASSPYAVSKLLNEHQYDYYRRRGIDTVVVRPFNHIGPGQAEGFLVPDLLQKLKHTNPDQPLSVGNLDTARDYTDVRDIANAYLAIAFSASLPHSLYNISSGVPTSGRQILEMLVTELHIPFPELINDPNLFRPTDASSIQGSAQRLFNDLGWTPKIPLTQTISDIVRESR